jgi:peptidoglycan/LPS O-acetylase OafA/YrhL
MQPNPLTAVGTRSVPVANDKYVPELDGLRAIAISIVVFAHYRLLPDVPGGFGVTLFFFLSGYLITTLFYAEYESSLDISIPRFYTRRWLRLTPNLIVMVVLAVAFYPVSRTAVGGDPVPPGTTMAALLYYTNYYILYWHMEPEKVIPLGICWSLAVEEHFYLAWPWFLRRNIGQRQKLWFIIAALCVGVLVWRCAARYVLHLSTDYTYMATDCRIDSILYGSLLRILFQTTWAAALVKLFRARTSLIVALLALLATFLIRDESFQQTFRYSIQGVALMPLFTAVLTYDPKTLVRRALSSPPMVLIGRLSYSIYLFHMLARTPGEVYFGSPYVAGSVISGLLLTAGIAYALFIFVERPIARLRRRFRKATTLDSLTERREPSRGV